MAEIDIIRIGIEVGFGLYCLFSLLGYGLRNMIKILK